METVEVVVEAHNQLGEGPLWDSRTQTLYWVDIEQSTILSYQPDTRSVTQHRVDRQVTSLGKSAGGRLIVTHRTGFSYYSPDTNTLQPILDIIQEDPDLRFNDGRVDPLGSYFAGTYSKSHRPIGKLYRFSPPDGLDIIEEGLINSNGIGWSPDNRIMYHTDTGRKTIYAYDYDPLTGAVANRRVFVQVSEEKGEGVPDGLAVDEHGFIWSARYYGSRIVRYDPDGKVEREIRLPVENITSCAFGGKDLCTLFITTAASSARSPLDGALFQLVGDIKGLEPPTFIA